MTNLREKTEDALVAITFAEAGEFEVARKILGEGEQPWMRVLVAIEDHTSNKETLSYALDLSKKMEAGLDILCVLRPVMDSALQNFRDQVNLELLQELKNRLDSLLFELKKEGIDYKLTFRTGYLTEEIIRYIENRKERFFLVMGSPYQINLTQIERKH